MIPNRFDDYNNEPHYNTVDASLWFIHAAFEYLRLVGGRSRRSREAAARLPGDHRRVRERHAVPHHDGRPTA